MLEITDSAVLMLSALLFFDSENLLPAFLAAAALHELGHVLALLVCGGRLRRLRVSALGGCMDCVLPEGQGRCFFIHLAGAAMNLAAFAVFRPLGCPRLAGANFVLFLFNLLPVCPLDGYTCLETISSQRSAPARRLLSTGFAILLLLAGSYLFFTGNGVSLAAVGTFLTVFSRKNLQKY